MVLYNKHRREIDNILAQFLAYIGLHPTRKSHHGIISLFVKYLLQCSGVKVVMNLQGKNGDLGDVEVLSPQ
jgi:hypothetical protein